MSVLHTILAGLLYLTIALLCAGGFVLSFVTLSGTWLVLLAAVVALLIPGQDYPGVWTLIGFALVSAAVEGIEAVASAMGVKKRGGSTAAGLLAIVGGILGMFAGTLIPIPLIGSVIGMLIGSFLFAFLYEQQRLKKTEHAAHIAWGTVIGRVFVLFLKITATLGMCIFLWVGLLRG
ncbi:MAG: DUF456 domain-containing protein [Verrucomicrobia bacterium]|nr:DUF456 domain-containing protein [Verrucomicrobiota bacterium]